MLKLAVVALLGAVSAVGAAEALNTLTDPKPELRAALAITPQAAAHAQPASIAQARYLERYQVLAKAVGLLPSDDAWHTE